MKQLPVDTVSGPHANPFSRDLHNYVYIGAVVTKLGGTRKGMSFTAAL